MAYTAPPLFFNQEYFPSQQEAVCVFYIELYLLMYKKVEASMFLSVRFVIYVGLWESHLQTDQGLNDFQRTQFLMKLWMSVVTCWQASPGSTLETREQHYKQDDLTLSQPWPELRNKDIKYISIGRSILHWRRKVKLKENSYI